MQTLKWIVLTVAFIEGSWLTFDGTRALTVGDYLTARSGPRAGQLGPWSRVVSALGFEPRSTLIKCVHLVLGIAWLMALMIFAVRPASGWWAILGCSIASLWYLPMGTVLSVLIIVLLLTPQLRSLQ